MGLEMQLLRFKAFYFAGLLSLWSWCHQVIAIEPSAMTDQEKACVVQRLTQYGFTPDQIAKIDFRKEEGFGWAAGISKILVGEDAVRPRWFSFLRGYKFDYRETFGLLHEMGHVQLNHVKKLGMLKVAAVGSGALLWASKKRWPFKWTSFATTWFGISRYQSYKFESEADDFALKRILQYPSLQNYIVLHSARSKFLDHSLACKEMQSELGLEVRNFRDRLTWHALVDEHPLSEDRAAKIELAARQMGDALPELWKKQLGNWTKW